MIKELLTSALLIISLSIFGQITVDNTVSAEEAMQTLLGENVSISNLSFIGFNEQIGTFNCEDCGLDFAEGIILSSGDVETALGPNNAGGQTIGGQFGATTEVDLNQLATLELHDVCVLEFDFVSLGDSVFFDFTWASDEYPEWSAPGQAYNDVFGFFISGPGINGPFSNNSENIALIPGTSEPVAIQNVNNGQDGLGGGNGCVNCEYYVNNEVDLDGNEIGYDGYTIGMTAMRGELICGETYHLKLAIADAGDNSLDSGVFLKAGSLSSNLTVGVELSVQATTEEGVMNEECGTAELIFTRPENIDSDIPFTVNVAYSGVAENGVDYTELPESIVFDPGVDVISFTLDAFEDGIIEGPELVQLEMQSVAVCQGESVPSSFEFFIIESIAPVIEGYEVEICDGNSIDIAPIIDGGSGGFEFEWSTDETTPSITVTPDQNTSYNVILSDTCLSTTSETDIMVNIAVYDPIEITATPNDLDISCNWFGEFMNGSATGGDGDYSFAWFDQDDTNLSNASDFYLFQNVTELELAVTDGCGITEVLDIPITTDVTPLTVDVPEEINVCQSEQVITAVIEGVEPFNINWYDDQFNFLSTTSEVTLEPTEDFILFLDVSDNCGQFFNTQIPVSIIDPAPLIIEPFIDFDASCEELVTIEENITTGSSPYIFQWNTESGANLGSDNSVSILIEETETIYFEVEDACGEIAQDTVTIQLVQTPLEITVPDFLSGDCLTEFNIEAGININQDVPLSWSGPADMELLNNYTVSYQSLGSGIITVSGDAGCLNTDQAEINISVSSPELSLIASPDIEICPEDQVTLSAEASGGSGQYIYEWLSEDVYDNQVTVAPTNSTSYTVQVTDECLNSVTEETTVQVEYLNIGFSYTAQDFNTFSLIPFVSPECEDCSYFWEFSG